MKVEIPSDSIIACICEGGAEIAIIDTLLDNDLLVFKRSQLIDEVVISRTSVKTFERRYLRLEYDQRIIVVRIIDSRSEAFKLSQAYRAQIEVINVITAPEIEMLIIVSQGKYADYCKSKIKKPSDYCKQVLKISSVKNPSFVRDYFSDPQFLIKSIKEYNRIHKQKNNEASLFDIIRQKD